MIGALLVLPFLLFYWMLPFIRSSLTIGQDYAVISPVEQLHLFFSLKTGSIPLFIPGYGGGGVSSATLTLGQLFHPISHVASWFPQYWRGGAFEVYTLLNLLSLGAAHALLYRASKKLGLTTGWALAVTAACIYNARTLDLFRFGAALQNGVGLYLAAAWAVLCWTGRLSLGRWTVMVGFLYLLITGGHPQMMYYGLLGAGLVMAAVPWVFGEDRGSGTGPVRFYLFCGAALSAAFVLTAAYTIPFVFDFLRHNSGRADRDFAWALNHPNDYMNWVGAADALLRPLHTNNQTAYGASSLLTLTAFVPLVWIFSKKKSPGVAVLWIIGAAIFCFPLGDQTPLYHLFWKYFPFASTFRVPGRATMILPVLMWLLLMWTLRQSDSEPPPNRRSVGIRTAPVTVCAAGATVLWTLYHALPLSGLEKLQYVTAHPNVINALSGRHDAIYFGLGLLTLLAVLAASLLPRRRSPYALAALCLLVLLQCGFTLRYGTWVKHKQDYDTYTRTGGDYRHYLQDSIALDRMKEEQAKKLQFVGTVSMGMTPRNVLEHAKKTFHVITNDPLASFCWGAVILPRDADPYVLKSVFENPSYCVVRPADFDGPAPGRFNASPDASGRIDLVYSHFNRLEFKTSSNHPGFFILSIPYFSRWRAFVDDKRVPVLEINGLKMGVRVPEGEHSVEWRYFSKAAAAGMAVSLAGLGLLLGVWLMRLRLAAWISILIAGAFAAGLWFAWCSHLYTGQNLNTRFEWSSPGGPSARANPTS